EGFEAVPIFGYQEQGMPKGRPVAQGKPAPNVIVDMDYVAQAAGLGMPGLGGFMLTKEYGLRQRFALVMTDAGLDPDPVCSESVCDNCGECAKACPMGAINMEKSRKRGVPGYQSDVATVDNTVCRACKNGAAFGPGRGTQADRLGAACARACLVHLEENGSCRNTFSNRFRKREPWALDVYGRTVEVAR
ncbi:MAG: hypothetical protein C0404_09955, partial [Verrucomicrobia bacterium]|nr:hypothetical protein [Verrucomicrobiota bacterium]